MLNLFCVRERTAEGIKSILKIVKMRADHRTFEKSSEVSSEGIVGNTRRANCASSQKRK